MIDLFFLHVCLRGKSWRFELYFCFWHAMSKNNELPSFPSIRVKDKTDTSSVNDWEQEGDGINSALNVSFLESLEEVTKFSYAGLCAGILQQLYYFDR